jgi:hypothetical protein
MFTTDKARAKMGRAFPQPASLRESQIKSLNHCAAVLVAFNRATEERFHLVVDLRAQATDLALGDASHAYRFDQLVDGAGPDAMHVGLLNQCGHYALKIAFSRAGG